MALTDADILVITPVIQTVRPVPQKETPGAAAVRPRMDVGQRLAIILMRPVARLTATKPDVPAGLIPVPMVAEAQENVVLLVPILNRLHRRLPAVVATTEMVTGMETAHLAHRLGHMSEKPVLDPAGVGRIMDNIGMFAVQKHIVLMAARKNIFVN